MTTTEELRSKKKAKKAEISQVANLIENRLEHYANWRNSVQEAPILSVAVAAGIGLLFSGVALPLFLLAGKQTGKIVQSGAVACISNIFSQSILRAILR